MIRSLLLASLVLVAIATVRPASAADVRVYIHQEMADYATFRKEYNSFEATRRKMGVIRSSVYQSVDNKNDVTVTHDFKTGDKAKAYVALPELKASMEKVGGKGPPQIWFTTRASK